MDRTVTTGLLYDAHAAAQALAARDLLALTVPGNPSRILEPGCGTGLYTALLAEAFPGATVDGVDKRADVIAAARARALPTRVSFRVADAEDLPAARYDLITSNAAFQWFRRLADTLARYMEMLGDGGALTFSFFGPRTYSELAAALAEVFGSGCRIAAADFHGRHDIEAVLAPLCRRLHVEERSYERRFASAADLLRSIRHTGTRGAPAGLPGLWTPSALARLERTYVRAHGAVIASYEVFLVRAER